MAHLRIHFRKMLSCSVETIMLVTKIVPEMKDSIFFVVAVVASSKRLCSYMFQVSNVGRVRGITDNHS